MTSSSYGLEQQQCVQLAARFSYCQRSNSLDKSNNKSHQVAVNPSFAMAKRHSQVNFLDLGMSLQSRMSRTGATIRVLF